MAMPNYLGLSLNRLRLSGYIKNRSAEAFLCGLCVSLVQGDNGELRKILGLNAPELQFTSRFE